MPRIRPKTAKKAKHQAILRVPGRPAKPSPKLSVGRRRAAPEIGEIVRKRAEAEAAIAEARRSRERLREAIELLPEGIVFLDADVAKVFKDSESVNRALRLLLDIAKSQLPPDRAA